MIFLLVLLFMEKKCFYEVNLCFNVSIEAQVIRLNQTKVHHPKQNVKLCNINVCVTMEHISPYLSFRIYVKWL